MAALELFSPERGGLTATEIAQRLGMSQGSLYPILNVLESSGYLIRTEAKRYRLGYKFLERASVVLQQSDVRSEARPYLQELAHSCRVNAHLATLHDNRVLYLWREAGGNAVIISEIVGWTEPAYCVAVGKVLLAALPEWALEEYLASQELVSITPRTITDPNTLRDELGRVRQQGFAVSNEEAHEGTVGIAAPVRDFSDRVKAGISLSVSKPRFVKERQRLVDAVRDTAARASRQLGWRGEGGDR